MKHSIFRKILYFLCLCAVFFAGVLPPAPFTTPTRPLTAKATSAQTPIYPPTLPTTGDYACILSNGTFFYATPDENQGLFLLPATYYVRLLDYGSEYCRVEYLYDDSQTKKLVGYARTNELTFVDYIPVRPYFYQTFELSYRIDDTLVTDSTFLTEITISCTYYGDYKIGSKTYCYVLRGDSFGYVPKPLTLVVRENTEYAEYLQQQAQSSASDSSEDSDGSKENSSPAQIAILIALCLLVPVLAAMILKPPRRPPYETDGD